MVSALCLLKVSIIEPFSNKSIFLGYFRTGASVLCPPPHFCISKSHKIFFRTKGIIRILGGFLLKTKGLCQSCTRQTFLGMKCLSSPAQRHVYISVIGDKYLSINRFSYDLVKF